MEECFVSVIIPLYNEERYINICMESLLLQDYSKKYMEWIFVDGCSSDRTKEMVNQYKKIS